MTRIQVYTDENAKQKAFQLRKKLQISNEELQLKHPELFVNPRSVEKAKVITIPIALPKTEANVPEVRDRLSVQRKGKQREITEERILAILADTTDHTNKYISNLFIKYTEIFISKAKGKKYRLIPVE